MALAADETTMKACVTISPLTGGRLLLHVVAQVGAELGGVLHGSDAVGVNRRRRSSWVVKAMRSFPGSAPTSCRNGRAGGGAQ